MDNGDFPSTLAYVRTAYAPPEPAVEQLRALQQEAINEGRTRDALEYGRMMNLMAARRADIGISLTKKAALAAVLGLVLVLVIHFWVS